MTTEHGTGEPSTGEHGTGEHSGGGDPRRSIELLWGAELGAEPRQKRGPKPKLTAPQITRTAIAVADAEGIAALSVRRIADELGVAPMSLYTYVPSKAELIDLMLDAVLGETLPEPDAGPTELDAGSTEPDAGRAAGWRDRLETVARANWALYHRHPWMLQVAQHRPVLGPNLIAKYDGELRAVDGIGLTDIEMDSVIRLITQYVEGAARASVEAAQVEQRSGMTDAQWWESNAPLLEKVLDPERFPVASRVGSAAGEAYQAPAAPDLHFEFGLERILDGIETLLQTRRA